MKTDHLPKTYMGYPVSELLQILKELQGPKGTKAPEEKIVAMRQLVREYKLTPVHQVPKDAPGRLNFSTNPINPINPHASTPNNKSTLMNVHDRIAEALLNIDKSDFNPGQDLLDAGKWITYDDPAYPGFIVKEYPDGTKELLDQKREIVRVIQPDCDQALEKKTQHADLPTTYMGYPVSELLQVLKELQGPTGTKAPKEKILAMDELVREYKLTPVHQVPMDAPGRLNFS